MNFTPFRANFAKLKRFQTTSSKLISTPFDINYTRKIRQSNEIFPRPNFISLDLFGTLYTPKKPVPEQYYEISHNEYGLDKSIESIDHDFPIVYDELIQQWPNCGKHVLNDCEKWWQELIFKLYKLDRNDPQAIELSNRLINHFSSDEAYSLYPDVIPALEELSKHNVKIIATSNSDLRVMKIMESLGITKYFEHGTFNKDIYLSYNLDSLKPDKQFFDKIALQLYQESVQTKADKVPLQYLENCWHVGDNYDQDFIGSLKAGWNGILINRSETSKNEYEVLANNRVIISDLRQLIELFAWDI